VDDLPLGWGHRLELVILTTSDDSLRCRLHDRDQFVPLPGAKAVDVQQQPDSPFRLPEDGNTGQLLKGIECLAVGTDEYVQVRALEFDVTPGLIDPCRDIAVDIERVQEPFQEVACSLGVRLDHLRIDWLVAVSPSRLGRVRPLRCSRCLRRLLRGRGGGGRFSRGFFEPRVAVSAGRAQ
jgi:hypothetical protein